MLKGNIVKKFISVLLCVVVAAGIAASFDYGVIEATAGDEKAEGVVLNKSYDATTGCLTLESYVTGVEVTVTKSLPLDVVLVLDVSGSLCSKKTSSVYVDTLNTDIGSNFGETPPSSLTLERDINKWYIDHTDYWYTSDPNITYSNNTSEATTSFGYGAVRYYGGKWQYFSPKTNGYGGEGKWVDISTTKKVNITYYYCLNLKIAALNFIKHLQENFPDATKCRVSIIPFGNAFFQTVKSYSKYNGGTEYTFYPCSCGLTPLTSSATVFSAINSIQAKDTETSIVSGLVQAKNYFDAASNGDGNERAVVVFSDGDPNHNQMDDSEPTETKDDAVYEALRLKTAKDKTVKNKATNEQEPGYGAKVYSVYYKTSSSGETNKKNCMRGISSFYPAATGATTSKLGEMNPECIPKDGSEVDGSPYYIEASNDNLIEQFKIVSENVTTNTATTVLGKETIIRDVISDKFELNKTVDKVKAYKVPVKSINSDGSIVWDTDDLDSKEITSSLTITYNSTSQTVDVTGFDLSVNWCGKSNGEPRGNKLVVIIPILPKDGADAGTDIQTNAPGSGIVEVTPEGEEKPVEDFPFPTTDLPASIKVKAVYDSTGYAIPDSMTFSPVISASARINGYLPPDEKNYSKATTEPKSYNDIVFSKDNKQYDGVTGLLLGTAERPSTITVADNNIPAGYELVISDGTKTYGPFEGGKGTMTNPPVINVADGLELTFTYKRVTMDSGSVTIKTSVEGNLADENDSVIIIENYTQGGSAKSETDTLDGKDEKTKDNVDYGSVFSFKPTCEGYTVKVKLNGEVIEPDENGVYSFNAGTDDVVEIISIKSVEVPTGVFLDSQPYFIITLGLTAAAIYITARKKKSDLIFDGE